MSQTSCVGGRHNMPLPLQVDLWPFDLESGVRVMCDVRYLCANFSLLRPLCSRLRPDVRDRQTDVRCTSLLNASALWGWGRNNFTVAFSVKFQILLVVHKMLRLKTDMRLDTFQKNVSRQTLHPVICHLNNNVITIVVVVVVTTN